MRRIEPHSLWLGTIVDAWDLRSLLAVGISAVVDLAANEAPIQLTRDIIYCRFPLVDGTGGNPVVLRLAMETTEQLVRSQVATFVFCSAGMSRSPVIVAAVLTKLEHLTFADALARVVVGHPHDVAPGFAADVERLLASDSVHP